MSSQFKSRIDFKEIDKKVTIWRKTTSSEVVEIFIAPEQEEIEIEQRHDLYREVSFIEGDDSLRISDEENRMELAKMIGLDVIPDRDPDAINVTLGVLDNLFEDDTEIDSTKIVKRTLIKEL